MNAAQHFDSAEGGQTVHCPTLVLVPSANCFEAESRLHDILAAFRQREAVRASDELQDRYDWYAIGGRFLDQFRGADCWPVRRLPKNIPDQVRHLVEPSGEWHDVDFRGCWPGASSAAGDLRIRKTRGVWVAEVTEVLSAYPDHHAVMLDLHH